MKTSDRHLVPLLCLVCLPVVAGCRRGGGERDEVQQRLLDLRCVDPSVRVEAAVALGQRSERAAVRPLSALLGDIRMDVRQAAVEALGQIGDPAAAPPLSEIVRDTAADANLRRLAAAALGRIGHPSGVPALEEALRSEDAELASAAAYALGRIGDESANAALVAALRGGTPLGRRAAAVVLGQSANTASAGRMRELLRDPSAEIRFSAAESLARMGDTQAVPAVVELLMDPSETVRLGVRPLVLNFREKAAAPMERILRLPGQTVERVGADGKKTLVDLGFARGVAREAVLKMKGRVAVGPLLLILSQDKARAGKDIEEIRRRLLALLTNADCRADLRAAIEADEAGPAEVGMAALADFFVAGFSEGGVREDEKPDEEARGEGPSDGEASGGGADENRSAPPAREAPDREACRELAARTLGGAGEARFHAARLLCALGDARGRDPLRREFATAVESVRKAWAEYDEKNPYPTKAPEGQKNKQGRPMTVEDAQRVWRHFRDGVAKEEIPRARACLEALAGVADKSLADEMLPVLKIGDAHRNYVWSAVLAAAVRIMDRVRDRSYVEPLLAAMESGRGEYLADVARALGALGDPRGFEPIERHIAQIGPNDQYMIRKRAKCYHGLYGCDRDRAAPLVGKILTAIPAHQRAAIEGTIGVVAQYPCAAAVPGLVHWLDHDVKHVREAARAALVSVAKGHVEWLIGSFDVESHTKRSALAGLIADEFGAAAVPALAQAARSKSPHMRQGGTWAMACIGGPEAEAVVRERLQDEHSAVRSAAAWGVGRLGNREMASGLVDLLANDDPSSRSMAAEQLGVLGATNAAGPLVRSLGDADARVRGYAAVSLAKINAREALDAVSALLKDGDPDVKAAAEYAVAALRGEKRIEPTK